MSEESPEDVELRQAIRQATRRLEQKSDAERRMLIQQAVEEALAEELTEKRAEMKREAEVVREVLTQDQPREEALYARRQAPGTILLLLMLLLILFLIAAATNRVSLIGFPGSQFSPGVPPTIQPRIEGQGGSDSQGAGVQVQGMAADGVAAASKLPQGMPDIGPLFRDYYVQHGGESVFGMPISDQLEVDGGTIQWFERARLESWPEYAGTPYAIQSGRLGAEFTSGIVFPRQGYFVSQPAVRYFAETGHGLGGAFLLFWEQHGGLAVLGYPISDEVQEVLSDKQIHTVQYFERGRVEYHPQLAGTPFEVQLGLLGRALYLNESKPHLIPPPQPTPVPLG